jgi:hypothetical protein
MGASNIILLTMASQIRTYCQEIWRQLRDLFVPGGPATSHAMNKKQTDFTVGLQSIQTNTKIHVFLALHVNSLLKLHCKMLTQGKLQQQKATSFCYLTFGESEKQPELR